MWDAVCNFHRFARSIRVDGSDGCHEDCHCGRFSSTSRKARRICRDHSLVYVIQISRSCCDDGILLVVSLPRMKTALDWNCTSAICNIRAGNDLKGVVSRSAVYVLSNLLITTSQQFVSISSIAISVSISCRESHFWSLQRLHLEMTDSGAGRA